MNNNPLVSVCIPCYNSEKTIKSTIICLLEQTYSNIEIVISDNHSTDNTIEIIKSIIDPRIKFFINESNLGIVKNFQKAYSYATGKYVKVICADDLLTPDGIEKQLSIFIKYPAQNIAMVTCEKWIINQNGKKLFQKKFPGKDGLHNGLKSIRKTIVLGTNIFGEPGCIMFNNEIAKQTSGFIIEEELTYVVDLNFYYQLLKHGNLFVIKEPLFSFRILNSSGSAHFKWKQAIIFNKFIDKCYSENFIKVSSLEMFIGKTMSLAMSLARNLIFKFAN